MPNSPMPSMNSENHENRPLSIETVLAARETALKWHDLIPNPKYPLFAETVERLFLDLNRYQPTKVLETGSGLTSALLRKFYHGGEVHTVESDPYWLAKTFKICTRMAVACTNFFHWHPFKNDTEKYGTYDYIIHDMGDMETRKKTLNEVLMFAAPTCVILLDNFGVSGYKAYANRIVRQQGFVSHYPPNPMTLSIDKAGAFAIFGRK